MNVNNKVRLKIGPCSQKISSKHLLPWVAAYCMSLQCMASVLLQLLHIRFFASHMLSQTSWSHRHYLPCSCLLAIVKIAFAIFFLAQRIVRKTMDLKALRYLLVLKINQRCTMLFLSDV